MAPAGGRLIAVRSEMSLAKTYVYVLKSKSGSAQYYIALYNDFRYSTRFLIAWSPRLRLNTWL